ALGLSTEDHLMAILRPSLQAQRILHSQDIEQATQSAMIRCAGLVVIRQAPPTAKGFRFITLVDEFGFINVIVRRQIYDRHRRVIGSEQLLVVYGDVEFE